MDIPKVVPHHPTAAQNAITPQIGSCQSCRTPVSKIVRQGGVELQKFLGHHDLLVDIMDVPQVTAEGTGLQRFPALVAFDVPCIPFGGGDTTPLQPVVGFSRELCLNPTGDADHCLHLGHVSLKPHLLKQASQEYPACAVGISHPSKQGMSR